MKKIIILVLISVVGIVGFYGYHYSAYLHLLSEHLNNDYANRSFETLVLDNDVSSLSYCSIGYAEFALDHDSKAKVSLVGNNPTLIVESAKVNLGIKPLIHPDKIAVAINEFRNHVSRCDWVSKNAQSISYQKDSLVGYYALWGKMPVPGFRDYMATKKDQFVENLTFVGWSISGFGYTQVHEFKSDYTRGLVYYGQDTRDYSSAAILIESLNNPMISQSLFIEVPNASKVKMEKEIKRLVKSYRFTIADYLAPKEQLNLIKEIVEVSSIENE